MDCTKDSDEVLLAELVDIVVDYKFEAAKARGNDLIIIYDIGYPGNG